MNVQDGAAILTAVGGGIALVAGIAEAIKQLAFPAGWQNGRAPMILVAALAAVLTALGIAQLGLSYATPGTWQAAAAAWLTIYTGAIGVHQTVTKSARIAGGTTDPSGPDAE